MVVARCIDIKTDKNNITSYTLMDLDDNKITVTYNQLLKVMIENKIKIYNLKLCNNKIVETKDIRRSIITKYLLYAINEEAHLEFKTMSLSEEKAYKYKVGLLGGNILKIRDICIAKVGDTTTCISRTGFKIANGTSLFENKEFKSIDLYDVDTTEVKDMSFMFSRCKANSINISTFDTSNCTNMRGMFNACRIDTLDLNNFDTSNVRDMSFMFSRYEGKYLNISKFSFKKLSSINCMFKQCKLNDLVLFDIGRTKYTNNNGKFYESDIKRCNIDFKNME